MEENKKAEGQEQEKDENEQSGKGNVSAANIDSIIGSATENVRSRRSDATWSNTGTNISYEGQTAPAGGGSVGTGESSGQSATGSRISTSDEYEAGRAEHPNDDEDHQKDESA